MFVFTLSFGEMIQFDSYFFGWVETTNQKKRCQKKDKIIKPLVSRSDKTVVGKDTLSAWNQEK